MNVLATLHRQHEELSRHLLGTLNAVLDFRDGDSAGRLALSLGAMVKLLREHLLLEDEWLYPMMIRANQPSAAAAAVELRDGMGLLADEIEDFQRRWGTSSVIETFPAQFRSEAIALFGRINDRIAREDRDLLPLAGLLGIDRQSSAA